MKKNKIKLKAGIKIFRLSGDGETPSFLSFNFRSGGAANQKGVAALLTVIIISAATLIMAYSASLLGLGELDMGYASQKGSEALALADGCVEDGFWRLRLNPAYAGGALTVNSGSCIISISANGSDRVVTAIASTTGGYYKKIEANITLSADAVPLVKINSWEEKSD